MKISMQVYIDLRKVFVEAMKHMQDRDDVRWSIGMALQELYGNEWMYSLQQSMVEEFEATQALQKDN
jgi:hypothetical protein